MDECLHCLAGTAKGEYRTAEERAFGRVLSDMQFQTIEEVLNRGLHEYLQNVQTVLDKIDDHIYQTFMYHPPTDMAAEIRLHQQEMQQQQAPTG